MTDRRWWLVLGAFALCAAPAQAQVGYYIPSGYAGFPVVSGPVYTPVPLGVQYMPAYQYVTPAVSTYNVPTIVPAAATQIEVVPTPAGTATTTTTTVTNSPVVSGPVYAPVPVATQYVTQTSYYAPAVVVPARVRFFPRRGVVRVRY